MADMTMGDLLDQASASGSTNKRAKMMRSMQAAAQKLRGMGMEPQEVDLLVRGQYGMLRPQDEEAYGNVMRKFAIMQRIGAIKGMKQNLQAYPGQQQAGGIDPDAAAAMQNLGFGGGGLQ